MEHLDEGCVVPALLHLWGVTKRGASLQLLWSWWQQVS